MKTPVMTFRTFERLAWVIDIGIALFIGAVLIALYGYYVFIPGVVAQVETSMAQEAMRIAHAARNGCDWIERDGRLFCKAKRGVK